MKLVTAKLQDSECASVECYESNLIQTWFLSSIMIYLCVMKLNKWDNEERPITFIRDLLWDETHINDFNTRVNNYVYLLRVPGSLLQPVII